MIGRSPLLKKKKKILCVWQTNRKSSDFVSLFDLYSITIVNFVNLIVT